MENIINQNDITNKCGKRIVMISSYCDTEEKINVLRNNIETIKSHNLDVMLNSPISLPTEIINLCDFYIQTKENPLLTWPKKSVMSWAKYYGEDQEITVKRSVIDYGWAALYQTKKLSEYALSYDYDRYYHIVYDLVIVDTVVSTFSSDEKCDFFPFSYVVALIQSNWKYCIRNGLWDICNSWKNITLRNTNCYCGCNCWWHWLWFVYSCACRIFSNHIFQCYCFWNYYYSSNYC